MKHLGFFLARLSFSMVCERPHCLRYFSLIEIFQRQLKKPQQHHHHHYHHCGCRRRRGRRCRYRTHCCCDCRRHCRRRRLQRCCRCFLIQRLMYIKKKCVTVSRFSFLFYFFILLLTAVVFQSILGCVVVYMLTCVSVCVRVWLCVYCIYNGTYSIIEE